jgi:signal transduction histidine kinase
METAHYKVLFEKCPSLFLILDPDLTIVEVTDAYLAATLTEREKIIGKGIFEVFPDNPDDLNADGVSNLRNSLLRVLEKKTPDTMAVQKYDIRRPESQGGGFEVRYWSPFNSPVLDENGNVKNIIHRVEDVTEYVSIRQAGIDQQEKNKELKELTVKMDLEILQRAKEIQNANESLRRINKQLLDKTKELERSNEDLGRFAETASHDIKAPFRGVGTYLGLIKRQLQNNKISDPALDEYFGLIDAERKRMSVLLDDLLAFARVTKSKEPLAIIETEEVVADVLKAIEYQVKESGARIIVPDSLPAVYGVKFQMEQLFQNILTNAIKFQDKNKPEITIAVTPKKEWFEFSIKDNGIGIKPEYFNKIFAPFERLHGQNMYTGTGLGLAICERIVSGHGGRMRVESEHGQGTTFYFTLQSAEEKD